MTATATQTFTSREAMDLLDVSYRQLNYWVEQGWVPGLAVVRNGGLGSGKGAHRWRWTPGQVAAARVVRDHLDQARALLADPTRCHRCPCGGGSP